jgi:hypothetical protein
MHRIYDMLFEDRVAMQSLGRLVMVDRYSLNFQSEILGEITHCMNCIGTILDFCVYSRRAP